MQTRLRRSALGVVLGAGVVLAPAAPALAAGTGTATVGPAAEAWYRTTPACALPTGCAGLTTTPSPYSADTLHVGVNAGAEEARTYLRLDLSALPAGTRPTGGRLLLPLATGSRDGTRSAQAAEVRACAVTAEVQDADGSFAPPPETDCDAASVPAELVAATPTTPAALAVDLAALTAAWSSGATAGAVALLPAEGASPSDTWHVAFSDRTRTGAGVEPVRAALSFTSGAVAPDTSAPAAAVSAPGSAPAPATAFDSAAFAAGLGTVAASPELAAAPLLPAPAAQVGPVPVAAATGPQAVVPVASVVPGGFRYPGVFLLPLLLAVGAGWLGRALTRDLADAERLS